MFANVNGRRCPTRPERGGSRLIGRSAASQRQRRCSPSARSPAKHQVAACLSLSPWLSRCYLFLPVLRCGPIICLGGFPRLLRDLDPRAPQLIPTSFTPAPADRSVPRIGCHLSRGLDTVNHRTYNKEREPDLHYWNTFLEHNSFCNIFSYRGIKPHSFVWNISPSCNAVIASGARRQPP